MLGWRAGLEQLMGRALGQEACGKVVGRKQAGLTRWAGRVAFGHLGWVGLGIGGFGLGPR